MPSVQAIVPPALALSGIGEPAWIDIVCAAVVLVFAAWDAVRGLSATLARIASLVLSFKLAFLLYPRIAALLPSSGAAAPALAFGLTILAAILVHLVLRAVFARVARVVLSAPLDGILGAIAGAIKGILLVFVVFSVIALATGSSYGGTAFAKSLTGSRVVPAAGRLIAPAGAKLPCSTGGR